MAKNIFFTALAFMAFLISLACKDPILGPTYPIDDFAEYDCVIVATVNTAVHEEEDYQALKTFKATVKKTLKGSLIVGTKINGIAKVEDARAVCPVHLDENAEYLLLLTKNKTEYSLSRFSFPVKKGYKYYNDYLSQIENLLNKEK